MDKNLVRNDETLDDLQLKGIKVIQKKNGFRFGIDAVLLANYTKVKNGDRIVDLCSGTGIIPFIIAGKTDAERITGVEIQKDMIDMANRSVKYNTLENKLDFINADLKDLKVLKSIGLVDIVTVNPPYKIYGTGLINENDKNAMSRHEIFCNLDNVIEAARILLKDKGRFFMIHRPERIADIMCSMRKYKIEPKVIRMIHPSYNKAPSMVLIEGQKSGKMFLKWERALYVYNENNEYTKEVKEIYGIK
ncbi:tRNA1(Val) (adenine(37)-N6)-methyltransferase [Clostridium niameyense]|uniref:tRNA1(Val) (Adenine(37)-N6)-methyltransferase n=1 Tax=Clostridium niameyense TaxID=1622073 RepID=A0A6M0RCD1_9CLOT|nr:tRNA1(Val) (adenine(37)-N6)-methyltransferase [Clostridium niameyense]NEZ47350.1 tRNA1(Val) (adenine(37)-N6)-methyltransferase [Clostridium niameyense]